MVPGVVLGEVPGEPGGTEELKLEGRGRQERRPLIRSPPFGPKSSKKAPPGPRTEPFGVIFVCAFEVCFFTFFLMSLFIDFETHSASILAPFLIKKSTLGPLGATRSIVKNHCFT